MDRRQQSGCFASRPAAGEVPHKSRIFNVDARRAMYVSAAGLHFLKAESRHDDMMRQLTRPGSGPLQISPPVFTDEDGQPLQRQTFSAKVWRLAVAKAGAPADTRFHDLRHYYASLLIQHGESVKTVQVRLGHATAAETLDTYSHLWPDSEDRTREAVDLVMGRSRLGVANG